MATPSRQIGWGAEENLLAFISKQIGYLTTVAYAAGESGGTGIISLNTLTNANQTLIVGVSGTDFSIVSTGTTHEFNLPTASATNRGLLSSADWTIFNGKQASLGYTPVNRAGDSMSGSLILNGDPSTALGAATKQYVDNLAAGINFHEPVYVATTGNLTATYTNGIAGVGAKLTSTSLGTLIIDGELVTSLKRVLVWQQSDPIENGIYDLTNDGIVGFWELTRTTDADNNPNGEIASGDFVFVQMGDTYGGFGFICNTTAPVVIGVTAINYVQFNSAQVVTAGYGLLELTPNVISADTSILLTKNFAITGDTKTKITYDANGLVTAGSDATTADIADSINKRYQTDLQQSYNDATSSIQTQFNGKQNTITLTTLGISGAATLVGDTLNIPQYSTNPSIIPTIDPSEIFRGRTFRVDNTTVDTYGGINTLNNASATAIIPNTTLFGNRFTRLRYYASIVSTGRVTSIRGVDLQWFRLGGFRFVTTFRVADTSYGATCQQFYGLINNIAEIPVGTVSLIQVSTLTNCIFVGNDGADTNLQVMHNDATGTCTKIDLGVAFPANRTAGAEMTTMYSIEIYNQVKSQDVLYKVVNLESGAVAQGTITTNLPLSAIGLTIQAARVMGSPISGTGQFELHKWGCYDITT